MPGIGVSANLTLHPTVELPVVAQVIEHGSSPDSEEVQRLRDTANQMLDKADAAQFAQYLSTLSTWNTLVGKLIESFDASTARIDEQSPFLPVFRSVVGYVAARKTELKELRCQMIRALRDRAKVEVASLCSDDRNPQSLEVHAQAEVRRVVAQELPKFRRWCERYESDRPQLDSLVAALKTANEKFCDGRRSFDTQVDSPTSDDDKFRRTLNVVTSVYDRVWRVALQRCADSVASSETPLSEMERHIKDVPESIAGDISAWQEVYATIVAMSRETEKHSRDYQELMSQADGFARTGSILYSRLGGRLSNIFNITSSRIDNQLGELISRLSTVEEQAPTLNLATEVAQGRGPEDAFGLVAIQRRIKDLGRLVSISTKLSEALRTPLRCHAQYVEDARQRLCSIAEALMDRYQSKISRGSSEILPDEVFDHALIQKIDHIIETSGTSAFSNTVAAGNTSCFIGLTNRLSMLLQQTMRGFSSFGG